MPFDVKPYLGRNRLVMPPAGSPVMAVGAYFVKEEFSFKDGRAKRLPFSVSEELVGL